MVSHQFPQIDIQILTSQVLFLDNSIIPLSSFHYQSLFSSSQLLCPALPTWKLLWPMPLTDFFHCPPVASLSLTSSHFLWKIETILVLILLISCGIVSTLSIYTIYETFIARTKLWFEIEVQCSFDLGMSPTVFHTYWDALLNCTGYWCESSMYAAEITIQSLNFYFSLG